MDVQEDRPRPARTLRNILLGVGLVALITCCALYKFFLPDDMLRGTRAASRSYFDKRLNHDAETTRTHKEDTCTLHDPDTEPLPAIRTKFGGRGTLVYGWPSTGGIWVHEDCYGLELDFLGLPRFEASATERYSPAEDEFCKRLQQIGARFYESEYAYNRQTYWDSREDEVWYGWPTGGGVWVLRTTSWGAAKLGVSRIRNALTMQERCKAIEMLGGGFYERWEDIPEDVVANVHDRYADDPMAEL